MEDYKLHFGDVTKNVIDWYHLDEIVDDAFVDQDVSVALQLKKMKTLME